MQNLLILFNPYYQSDVIEQHLKLLIQNEKVAFGKIKSKLNDKNGKVEKISLIGGEKFKINQSNNSYININNPENDFHRNIIEWYKKEFERIEEVLK